LIDLRHGRVYQWITRSAFAPSRKQGLAVGAMIPLNGVVVSFEAALGDMGKIG
jgi:hypothetical protein